MHKFALTLIASAALLAIGALHSQRAEAMISNFSAGARTYENTMMQPVSWWRPCYGYYKPYYYPYYCRPYYYRSWYCPRPLYPYRAFKPCDCGQERRPTAGRTILVRIGAGISPHLWGLESPAAALSGHCPSPGPQFLFRQVFARHESAELPYCRCSSTRGIGHARTFGNYPRRSRDRGNRRAPDGRVRRPSGGI